MAPYACLSNPNEVHIFAQCGSASRNWKAEPKQETNVPVSCRWRLVGRTTCAPKQRGGMRLEPAEATPVVNLTPCVGATSRRSAIVHRDHGAWWSRIRPTRQSQLHSKRPVRFRGRRSPGARSTGPTAAPDPEAERCWAAPVDARALQSRQNMESPPGQSAACGWWSPGCIGDPMCTGCITVWICRTLNRTGGDVQL